MKLSPRLVRALFWLLLLAIYVVAIVPHPPRTGTGDSYEHALAFIVLTIAARIAWPRAAAWQIFAGLAAFGALIEFTQLIPILHRQSEMKDWLVDIGATLATLVVIEPIARAVRQRA